MAFIVEDGSIVANATAYITEAFLDAYWLDRGVVFTEDPAAKEAAIIVATQYVDLNNTWKGRIVSSDQALDFPRSGIIDDEGRIIASDSIPEQLKNAVAEYTKRQLSATLQPDVSDLGTIKRTKKKVDVIDTETEYQEGTGGYFGLRSYPLADNYLIGLIEGGVSGNFGRVGTC